MTRKKKGILLGLSIAVFVLVAVGGYVGWNRLDPVHTCAQCHEVSPSHEKWLGSAHAEVHCTECHGTAFSNGLHSAVEKMGMVWSHLKGGKRNEDIWLSEKQVLDIHAQCARCHQSEYKGWLAGGHAVTYDDIFTDSLHNHTEKPYWDCMRCHGMFYEGSIHDLMALDGVDPGDWKIRDERQGQRPAVPCLACHNVHTGNPVSHWYVSTRDSIAPRLGDRRATSALYMRADKIHLRSDDLMPVDMFRDGRKVDAATDPATLLCMQCHSPNYRHVAGSEDDRTVTGVHEGLSCIACHDPHSHRTQESCFKCHSELADKKIEAVFNNPHAYTGSD